MGNILECRGNKTFQNLEQCHEIQGEYKKILLNKINSTTYYEKKSVKNTFNEILYNINKQDSDLNIIINNSDEFCNEISNVKEDSSYIKQKNLGIYPSKNSDNYKNSVFKAKITDSIKLKKMKQNNSSDKKNNKNENYININFEKNKNKINEEIKLINANQELIKSKCNNNSENNNIKSKKFKFEKFNDKKEKNNIYNLKSKNNNNKYNKKNGKKPSNKIINKIYFGNNKRKNINYIEYNKINPNNEINKEKLDFKAKYMIKSKIRNRKPIKRIESYQNIASFPKLSNLSTTNKENTLKRKKGSYKFTPRINSQILYYGNIFENTSKSNNKRNSNISNKLFSSNSVNSKNYRKAKISETSSNLNDTTKSKKIQLGKLKNNSESNIHSSINSKKSKEKQTFESDKYKINNNKKELNNIVNSDKEKNINNEEKIKEKNIKYKDYNIKINISFKGTQINQNILNNSANNIIIINYNILSRYSDNIILYDGNFYIIDNKSNLYLRYFQITKKYFSYYKNIHSIFSQNTFPLDSFEIKNIDKIDILDKNSLMDKNENKINFEFLIKIKERKKVYVFATDDKEIGMNIINIINLIKKYYEEKII